MKPLETEISGKLDGIGKNINDLLSRVGTLEGRFKQLDSDQKKLSGRLGAQEALNRVQDPPRLLAIIRTSIQAADASKQPLDTAVLADYRNAIQGLPSSAHAY